MLYCDAGMARSASRGSVCNSGFRCNILQLLRQVPSSTTRRSADGASSTEESGAATPGAAGYNSTGVRPPACSSAAKACGSKLSPVTITLPGKLKCSK